MFKRKGEGSSQEPEGDLPKVDLSPLADEEGFVVGEGASVVPETEEIAAESVPMVPEVESIASEASGVIENARPMEAASPRKKRYYTPGEVRRKKGCIGCGGMVLAVPFLMSVVGIAVAVF